MSVCAGEEYKVEEGDVVEITLDLTTRDGALIFKRNGREFPGRIDNVKTLLAAGSHGLVDDDIEVFLALQMSTPGDKARLFFPPEAAVQDKKQQELPSMARVRSSATSSTASSYDLSRGPSLV